MIEAALFYLFAGVLVLGSMLVIAAKNPVHSVLYLILCFFNAAGLFILLQAEFIAFVLIIVYVGAVAVLFLFVVMMLDIHLVNTPKVIKHNLPVGLGVGAVLLVQLCVTLSAWSFSPTFLKHQSTDVLSVENTRALGRILYTDYFFPFQVSGLILLVAMVGAIVLTLRHRPEVKRQKVHDQLYRDQSSVIEVRKVASGEGVSL